MQGSPNRSTAVYSIQFLLRARARPKNLKSSATVAGAVELSSYACGKQQQRVGYRPELGKRRASLGTAGSCATWAWLEVALFSQSMTWQFPEQRYKTRTASPRAVPRSGIPDTS